MAPNDLEEMKLLDDSAKIDELEDMKNANSVESQRESSQKTGKKRKGKKSAKLDQTDANIADTIH